MLDTTFHLIKNGFPASNQRVEVRIRDQESGAIVLLDYPLRLTFGRWYNAISGQQVLEKIQSWRYWSVRECKPKPIKGPTKPLDHLLDALLPADLPRSRNIAEAARQQRLQPPTTIMAVKMGAARSALKTRVRLSLLGHA